MNAVFGLSVEFFFGFGMIDSAWCLVMERKRAKATDFYPLATQHGAHHFFEDDMHALSNVLRT